MPTKKGAGGRQQNYNSHTGRYEKFCILGSDKYIPSRKELARKKEENRRLLLFNRAKNSKDTCLFETYLEIESSLPGSVQFVNEQKFDPNINNKRELDIITRKCIIEIKSSNRLQSCTNQFNMQKKYAESKNKHYLVFAPNVSLLSIKNFQNKGINVIRNYESLVSKIKEFEK